MGCSQSLPPHHQPLLSGSPVSEATNHRPPTPLASPTVTPFELHQFLLSHSASCSLDLSNSRCSNLDLETNLIPVLSPTHQNNPHLNSFPSSTVSSPASTPHRMSTEKWMSLNLRNNSLTAHSIEMLAGCLIDNPTCRLQALHLHGNYCGDEGVGFLVLALRDPNTRLKILGLDANSITDVGAQLLGSALPSCVLEWLFLNDNPITDLGLAALCQGINSSKLKLLGLGNTLITNQGVREVLLPICEASFGLKQVVVGGKGVALELQRAVKQSLELKNSAWVGVRVALASVKHIPRLGLKSPLRALGMDLIQRILALLPYSPSPAHAAVCAN
ncbi:hypothetical protein BASA81_004232 [Batrachochytrium salamandrivorans]|nr:hypothetical protein BASA81_004232 [Batrachochytrium salamandrivorans]